MEGGRGPLNPKNEKFFLLAVYQIFLYVDPPEMESYSRLWVGPRSVIILAQIWGEVGFGVGSFGLFLKFYFSSEKNKNLRV